MSVAAVLAATRAAFTWREISEVRQAFEKLVRLISGALYVP